ncbi:MAG: ASCH domain-containing protein [Cyanobacteriota bacterium]|nr:ASCH domain-containing protein [Cyanobacteriota bacterium]
MSPTILLLSIHNKYANMLFEGDKQVELRRVRPRHLHNDDLILVYVTSPKQALVGLLKVEKIVENSPDNLWEIVKKKAGLTHKEFKDYYKNSPTGVAIFVNKTFSFETPIKLENLKKEWSDFRPPQCYRYLKDAEICLIQSLTRYELSSLSEQSEYCQLELSLSLES